MATLIRPALVLFFLLPRVVFAEEMRSAWYETGTRTASGAPFNPDNPVICAHRTLPLHTLLYVVNRKNGKNAWLQVLDRGPVSHSLDLDVSRAAAKQLGFIKSGVATLDVVIYPPR